MELQLFICAVEEVFGGNVGRFDGVVFGWAGSGFVVLCVVSCVIYYYYYYYYFKFIPITTSQVEQLSVLLAKYCSEIEKNEMGWARSAYG
jgi:hypothetical protein